MHPQVLHWNETKSLSPPIDPSMHPCKYWRHFCRAAACVSYKYGYTKFTHYCCGTRRKKLGILFFSFSVAKLNWCFYSVKILVLDLSWRILSRYHIPTIFYMYINRKISQNLTLQRGGSTNYSRVKQNIGLQCKRGGGKAKKNGQILGPIRPTSNPGSPTLLSPTKP